MSSEKNTDGAASMIRVVNVTKHFGGVRAVENTSLDIGAGTITGLIGPNGAGKTTLFNVIAGNIEPTSGRVILDGDDVTGFKPHELFARGLLRTFQISHEFPTLTVLENLMMVPPNQYGERLADALFRPGPIRGQEKEIYDRAEYVVDFLNLSSVAREEACKLSGGQKKLLELGRTMMTEAKVILLDEVGAGVNRTLLNSLGDAIVRLNEEKGYTFFMIEHDMDFIARLCGWVIVMAEGAVLAEGAADEIRRNEDVIEIYLGRGAKYGPGIVAP